MDWGVMTQTEGLGEELGGLGWRSGRVPHRPTQFPIRPELYRGGSMGEPACEQARPYCSSAITGWRKVPTAEISISTISPGLSQRGGVR